MILFISSLTERLAIFWAIETSKTKISSHELDESVGIVVLSSNLKLIST